MATTILLGFATISIILLIVAIFVLIEATHELTNAINGLREMHKGNSKDDEVKFIGPTTSQFGRSPAPMKGNLKKSKGNKFIGPKNRKSWGIH
jgi:hypothetical protein